VVKRAAVALIGVTGAWVLYTFPPATSNFYPLCFFKVTTGLDCPGCGSTRALHALLHGRIAEAFRFNPLLFAVMIVGLFALPSLVRGETPRFMETRWFGWTSAILISAWWIARNVWNAGVLAG
jgi:hypothetical protein